MKVLHYHFGKDGGAEGFFVHLVNALAARGVQQKVIIRPQRRWRPEIDKVAEVAAESHFRSLSLDRLRVRYTADRLIRSFRPDAVLAWMSRAGHLLPRNAECRKLARLGGYPDHLRQFRHADTLVCNTPDIARHVRELGWQKEVAVVSNFTSPRRGIPIKRGLLDTPNDVKVVCGVGRLISSKGFDTLIRSLRESIGTHLWIVGDGPEKDNLVRLACELDVNDRVRFLGWQDDVTRYIAAADVFAMASRHEPLGNVILEGWSQNVPVVATRAEGPSWLIQHERNGLLVDIEDARGLAAAFDRIGNQRDLADRLVAGGRMTLEGSFSQEVIVDQYMKLFCGDCGVRSAPVSTSDGFQHKTMLVEGKNDSRTTIHHPHASRIDERITRSATVQAAP